MRNLMVVVMMLVGIVGFGGELDYVQTLKKLQPKMDVSVAAKISRAVDKYSSEYGVDPWLVISIMMKESSLNPYSESSCRCVGLMQVNYSVWKAELGLGSYYSMFSINENIEAGCRILSHYTKKEKDLETALSRYSGGARSYHPIVMKIYNKIREAKNVKN